MRKLCVSGRVKNNVERVERESWLFTNNPVYIVESSLTGMSGSVQNAGVAVLLDMPALLVCAPSRKTSKSVPGAGDLCLSHALHAVSKPLSTSDVRSAEPD